MDITKDFNKQILKISGFRHINFENYADFQNRIDDMFYQDFNGITGENAVKILVETLEKLNIKKEKPPILEIVKMLNSIKDNNKLYIAIRDGILDFSKYGPEIYKKVEKGYISPEKQWEINLKKQQNIFLEGHSDDKTITNALLTALHKTKVPFTIKHLPILISNEQIDKLASDLVNTKSQFITLTNFTINKKGEENFVVATVGNDTISIPISLDNIDTSNLCHMCTNLFKDYLSDFNINDNRASFPSLTKSQIPIYLNTFLKVSQKYQGIMLQSQKELDLTLKGLQLTKKEFELTQKEIKLTEKELTLTKKEHNLQEKETKLKSKETDIASEVLNENTPLPNKYNMVDGINNFFDTIKSVSPSASDFEQNSDDIDL